MEDYHATNSCYKLQLVIDGCNGPIRFREHCLRRATETTTTPAEGGISDSDGNGGAEVSSRNHDHGDVGCNDGDDDHNDDDDETILSFLRPESIAVGKQKQKLCNNSSSSKSKRNAKSGRKKTTRKPKTCTAEDAEWVEESSNHRLDMIPLLEKLLMPSTRSEIDRNPDGRQLFDSISVVFDGISITKRPPVPASNPKKKNQEEEAIEEELVRGRLWHVSSDTPNATKAVMDGEAGFCDSVDKSGHLTIEVTGLYDEADNVIVERIREQQHDRRATDRDILHPANGSDPAIETTGDGGAHSDAVTRIQMLRRTERGAGKNRRLFQNLGLLRPESVACVFEFGAPITTPTPTATTTTTTITTTSNDCDDGQEEHESGHSGGHKQSRLESSSFRRLALDGDQTLRSVRRHNPGNVFLALDEPLEIPHATGGEKGVPVIIPIVATDDIFLRQRIVHEGGFVMTFHQLWLLLIDVV